MTRATDKSTPQILGADFLRAGMSRRRLLAGAGAVGAALVAAACGSDDDTSADSTPGTTAGPTAGTTATTTVATIADATMSSAGGDLGIAELAAGLEVLAVNTYKTALDAAGSGALGAVPPAVGEFVTTAMAQHQEHLDAWNTVITAGGGSPVTEPNTELDPVVAAQLAKVTDVAGAARLALMLEQIASATYLSALPLIEDKDAIELAGSIQVIDMQHQSILLFALGEYPVPDVFAPVDKSAA